MEENGLVAPIHWCVKRLNWDYAYMIVKRTGWAGDMQMWETGHFPGNDPMNTDVQ